MWNLKAVAEQTIEDTLVLYQAERAAFKFN
jgi:hypothetical protein